MSKLLYGGSGQQTWPTAAEEDYEVLVLAGDLATAKVMLFTNALAYPVKDLAFATLTPPTFTGYAVSAAIVWGTPFLDLNGNVVVTGQKLQFLCTADGTPNSVTGAAIIDGAGTKILQCDIFLNPDGTPAPVTFETNGDALDYVPVFSFVNRGQNT